MMSKYLRFFGFIVVFIAVIAGGSTTLADTALSSTFTYQGFLSLGGAPVTNNCDFQFSLFDDLTVGAPDVQIGSTQTRLSVAVSGGVFTTQLDLGPIAFDGSDRYLDIGVRCPAGSAVYTTLAPRSAVTSTPYAIHAVNANELLAMRVQYNATSPNLIGGFSGNAIGAGVLGSTISGGGGSGLLNQITDNFGTIGGGQGNTVGDTDGDPTNVRWATVVGGVNNNASGSGAFVGGGEENSAIGLYSVVPGGFQNNASASYTFAAGNSAQAIHSGSFVWSDSSGSVSSTVANQFIARASGGFVFYTATGTTSGAQLPAGDGGWVNLSDRNVKNNFAMIDSLAILDEVATMPISTWNYIAQGDAVRHIGPMAQDFYAAFGLGLDDKHISTIDADGVALAAIQGLYQVVQDKDTQIINLQAENESLKTRLNDLDQRLVALEAIAAPSQAGLSLPVVLALFLAGGAGLVGRRFLRQDA